MTYQDSIRAIAGRQPEARQLPKTVLIVEDNELNMKLFHDLLDAHGYTTLQTRSGIDALGLQKGQGLFARVSRQHLEIFGRKPRLEQLDVGQDVVNDQYAASHR